jgi:hypothetical protein
MIIKCDNCRKEFFRTTGHANRYKHQFCSYQCRSIYWKANKENWEEVNKKRSNALKGSKSYLWRGGKSITRFGYVEIYKPEHPYSQKRGYVMEHRLVIEEYLGRYLKPEEQVHHINGDKSDNRIENLILFASNGEHIKYHWELLSEAI